MVGPRQKNIKLAQKEEQLLRELASLFMQISQDEPRLQDLFLNRVHLSPDKGSCSIFFFSPLGKQKFDELFPILILYKPSLRAALAKRIPARYTPQLIFRFDDQFEKQQRIENLLEKIKTEEQS